MNSDGLRKIPKLLASIFENVENAAYAWDLSEVRNLCFVLTRHQWLTKLHSSYKFHNAHANWDDASGPDKLNGATGQPSSHEK